VGYGDYLEQLTYLLFLKLAHEYAQEPYYRDTHMALWFLPGQSNIIKTIACNQARLPLVERLFSL
jgi:hypothetical protein